MKYLSLASVLFLTIIFGCKSTQPLLTIPTNIEERSLDTIMVTAPEFNLEEEVAMEEEEEDYELPSFNPSAERTFDLLHTKLDIRFNWEKQQVIGAANLLLKPFFYETDQLVLDAKGFEFNEIRFADAKAPLKYEYDGQQVVINLNKIYTRTDTLEIFIDYVATPEASGGSSAITSDKGLFFINPTGEDNKPQQIWTQGETEHNSKWFPTIDKPNERTTQEMYITVQDKYRTLSNGLLIESKDNEDGTRTDYWKMDQPHAPYLFMVAVGEFAVVQERWQDIMLEYYVEPKYRERAKEIFPNTPKMLTFFSEKLGIKYPWQKYAQIVVRDYVSGAMENTTAVIFGEFMHEKDYGEIYSEKIVAHEMFHHWFGDYVTTESWANLTMNEGFANYSEYLWIEENYGRAEADYHWLQELRDYLSEAAFHPLIHYGYGDKEEMFDRHSYNKGGLVLHMLRNYVGDEAFWAALNLYLTRNAYTEVEADELRLAFEDVTGKDLIWFFEQWFFEAGHPQLDIQYDYDEATQKAIVTVEQQQDAKEMVPIFQLPVTIDIYTAPDKKMSQEVMINERLQTFEFDVSARPKLINFDADRVLLAVKQDNKTTEEYFFQLNHTPLFLDRYEAMQSLAQSDTADTRRIFEAALKDEFYALRAFGVYQVELSEPLVEQIIELTKSDPHPDVRSAAVERLIETQDPQYANVFEQVLETEESADVKGMAYQGLGALYVANGDVSKLSFFEEHWSKIEQYDALTFLGAYAELLTQADTPKILESAKKLKEVALTDSSIFRRFGATNAINTLHAHLYQLAEDAAESNIMQFADADAEVMEMLNEVLEKETDPQLQQVYVNFPNPLPKE